MKSSTVIIRPKMYNVEGMFDDRMKEELYLAGKVACLEALPRIKEALAARSKRWMMPLRKLLGSRCLVINHKV